MLTATNYKYRNFTSSKIACFISVDPLQFKYAYYTPYQYAGNKPVSYIDIDGAEEESTKENNEIETIGLGLIFGNKKTIESVNNQNSLNWYGFELYNLHYAIEDMKDVKSGGEKIGAVYFQMHYLGFNPGSDNRINTDGVSLSDSGTYISGGNLAEDDNYIDNYQISWFLQLTDEEYEAYDKKLFTNGIFSDSQYFDTMKEIIEVANLIEDGGYLILGGCGAAMNENNLYALSQLTGGRVHIIASSTNVRGTVTETKKNSILYKFLDVGRSESGLDQEKFKKGWGIIGPSTKEFVEYRNKDIILKSEGDYFIEFVDYNLK